MIRHNWTFEEADALYQQPFMDLLWQAQTVHRAHFNPNTVQVCTLFNIKVGGCPEDCHWCGQSIYNGTGVTNEPLAKLDEVLRMAEEAKARGATRFCMAASWRNPTQRNLESVMEMVKGIKALGLEACITLGKLKPEQAEQLRDMGLDYYNHNLESSKDHFQKVSTTRDYQDRLNTLEYVRQVGMKVCSGGILGMSETHEDRIELLLTLANQPQHPQSVPMNRLVPIPGTPLADEPTLDDITFVRCVALARIMMPKAYVRLSGGRAQMSKSLQTLAFLAGANSIHHGPKLLVTLNADMAQDSALFKDLGIKPEGSEELISYETIPCEVHAG